jgi:nucleoside-diphosphate-sugar epimerase
MKYGKRNKNLAFALNERLPNNKTKILITGSRGFIGKHLVRALKNSNEIVEFDLKRNKNEDIRIFKNLFKKAKGCEAIVHLAALTINSESMRKPHEYFFTNVIGTLNALEVARLLKIKKFIFASSAGVERGKTAYSISKLIGEQLTMFYHKNYNLQTYILKIYNVYGKRNKKGVIFKFLNRIKKNKPLIVNNDGQQRRDFIHVEDVVRAIIKILRSNSKPGIYEIGTGKSTKIIDLANLIFKLANKKTGIVYKKLAYEEIKTSKARKPFLKDTKNLEEGLKELL